MDQELNSLVVQRDACEAYISSQKGSGWILVPDEFDDGGWSGGNVERPALKRLFQEVERGNIDCIVVHRIDRLSRSLADFVRMVEMFEKNNVSFVSVTQQFSTTSSMGRLTLNILLSFAQFEREVTAERIREKVAASKQKGMWVGGYPPLSYNIHNQTLVINEPEAELIRHVFQRFTQIGSCIELVKELNAAGHRTKTWTTQSGKHIAGKPFDKGTLYRLLNNKTFIGKAVHKENVYPGEHEAIIDKPLWDKVHSIMDKNRHKRSNRTRTQTPAPLKGIIQCQHCNRAMTTSHTRKKGKLYRYYLCVNAAKTGYDNCPIGMVSAGEVEGVILDRLRLLFRSPEMVARIWQKSEGLKERQIIEALKQIDPMWNELFPREQTRLLHLLVSKVEVSLDDVNVHLRVEGFNTLAADLATDTREITV